jgi:hypothetical protein
VRIFIFRINTKAVEVSVAYSGSFSRPSTDRCRILETGKTAVAYGPEEAAAEQLFAPPPSSKCGLTQRGVFADSTGQVATFSFPPPNPKQWKNYYHALGTTIGQSNDKAFKKLGTLYRHSQVS